MKKKVIKLVLTALFAALTCVATMIIKVPTFGTNGYVNIGATIVLLCAWIIGGVYGAVAAGVGSALADLLSGYASYAPGTLVIKFLMALVAFAIFYAFKKIKINKYVTYIISGIVAELIMIFGYFLYESTLLGYGLAAAGSIGSNAIQGVTCLALSLAAIVALELSTATKLVKENI